MSKAPPIPKEQRSFRGQRPDIEGGQQDRHDVKFGLQATDHGDGSVNLKSQGAQANIRQNVDTVHARTQDR